MQEKNKILEFVKSVNFEIIDSLKNNGTKYLLTFDDSCEEICKSKVFVYIATAERHLGLRTFYIKQNLFRQSILGRDLELRNAHIVLFTSPRELMQVSTLSAHLGLRTKLFDWYRDATSVLYGHLLIDLSLGIGNRLRSCTSTGYIP